MIAVVVINYRSEEKTIEFVKNELSKISGDYAVIVVDNASTQQSQMTFLDAFKRVNQYVFVVPSETNLGFAKGCDLGAQVAKNQFNPDAILFANNDIVMTDANVVDVLYEKLQSIPEAGLIGPKVLGLDGKNQSPEPYFSFWKRHIWLYWSNLFMSQEKRKQVFMTDYAETATEGFHYKLSGSFFMVRAEDFFKCDMMDQATFLYAEEVILTERMAGIGRRPYYYPAVQVLHEHGATTKKYYDEVKIRDMKFKSECYYYRQYKGTSLFLFPIAKFTYWLKGVFHR